MRKKLLSTGFESPNFTQVPNDLFDMLPDMSDTELRVTLIMIRNTFGYHRQDFKLGIRKLAESAGLSYNGATTGANEAQERGTFCRTNPDEKTEAEWELVVQTPSASEGVFDKHPQPVRETPSASEGQVGLNKRNKELNKLAQAPKNSLPMPIENQIYSDIETIELQNDFQKWQAERDIALMKICMFGADLEPLAMAFMDARHMIPATQKQIKSWGAAFREMKKSGVNADHIKRAVEKLSQHGMTIADPWAVDKTARDLCAQPEGYKYDLVY